MWRYINDPRTNPYHDDVTKRNDGVDRANVEWLEILIKGIPYKFMYASKNIIKGDELLVDYGKEYWEAMQVVTNRDKNIKSLAKTICTIEV